jgi:8-oxo-dGTP diphosphatase
MKQYGDQTRLLAAIDCIIFGFDGEELKLLLIQRGFRPEKGKWSLMGGFVQPKEGLEKAAARILKQLTGLENVYMEQLQAFGEPGRDPVERTVSIAFFALVNIFNYEKQLSDNYHPEWISVKKLPSLVFDHRRMVEIAKKRLQYKAALHPLLFELLPDKFTMPQLLNLYQAVYDKKLDKRNFNRKLLSAKLLIKQKNKERENSRRGAFYYKLDKRKYYSHFDAFMSFLPTRDIFSG